MNKAFVYSYNCLNEIYKNKAYSEIALNNCLLGANAKDKPLITKIVYGVLDNSANIDYIISQFAKSIKPSARLALRIGVYCLNYLSIPNYAVINDTVELAKVTGKIQLVAFVNATLRSISRAIDEKTIAYPTKTDEYLSVYYSFPLFAVKMLIKQYGKETTEKILAYKFNTNTHLRINLLKTTMEDFTALLDENCILHYPSPLPDCLYCKGNLQSIPTDLYTNMSLGSCIIARSLHTEGEAKVLDLCSAPGGKAVYIASLNSQAKITACDLYPHKISLIKNYAKRIGVDDRITAQVSDASVYNPDFECAYDYVLCDVPCSGLGVFYSKPDIKLNRTKESIDELTVLQMKILCNAAKYVRSGGVIVYSTCSILREENDNIVGLFLKEHPDFAKDKLDITVKPHDDFKKQFLPPVDDCEGFFVARIIKK